MSAYLVLDISIHDFRRFQVYIKNIPEFIEKHQGKYIVQGVEPEVMEGDWSPERMVILEFLSRDHAKNFLADPEAQNLFKIRHNSTTSKLLLLEGAEP
ncbi:MAG: DUF1330 domain-containing protein [Gammaproteobacteria bacterium]|nr:DUF1330 domain-containing protein [Gammaproteobacteria bacterium]